MKIQLVKELNKDTSNTITHKCVKLADIISVEPASCSEIIVGDLLDYCNNKAEMFKQLISKLRYDGVINISGLDLDILCNEYNNGYLTPYEMVGLLYSNKVSIDTLYGVVAMCKHHGLDVIIEDISDKSYIVSAKRIKNGESNQQNTYIV